MEKKLVEWCVSFPTKADLGELNTDEAWLAVSIIKISAWASKPTWKCCWRAGHTAPGGLQPAPYRAWWPAAGTILGLVAYSRCRTGPGGLQPPAVSAVPHTYAIRPTWSVYLWSVPD